MGILSKDKLSRKDTLEAAKGEEGEEPKKFKPRAKLVEDGEGNRRLYMQLEDPTNVSQQSPHLDALLKRLIESDREDSSTSVD